MREEQKKFIEDNIQLIEENKWFEFFSKSRLKPGADVCMGGILYEANIDWLPYMNYIPTYSFAHSKVVSIYLPANIAYIDICAFEDCKNLETVHINDGVRRIEEGAFRWCSNLKSVNIPYGVRSIKKELFSHCSSLEEIDLPHSLTVIDDYAFHFCTSISHIDIPDKVKKIKFGAFEGCTNLKHINLNNATELDSALFYYCSSLEEITLPQGTQKIRWKMFSNCHSLKYITIPYSVLSIHPLAFEGVTQTINITYGGTKNDWTSLIQPVKDIKYVCKCADGIVEN